MKYRDLLGVSIKDDILLDLFETYDVEVIYRYDRNHEDLEDEYIAEIPEMGLEFIFDSDKCLQTLFMKCVDHNGYNPFENEDPRHAPFKSNIEAIDWAKERSIDFIHQDAKTDVLLGEIPEWIKFTYQAYFVHYQFRDNVVDMVTISSDHA